jgi:hypothetical protein
MTDELPTPEELAASTMAEMHDAMQPTLEGRLAWFESHYATAKPRDLLRLAQDAVEEVRRLRIGEVWHDIATAPRDGTAILAYCRGRMKVVWSVTNTEESMEKVVVLESPRLPAFEPTHWMPLPEPPELPKKVEQGR